MRTIIAPGSMVTTQSDGFRELAAHGYRHRQQMPMRTIGNANTDLGEQIQKELEQLVSEILNHSTGDLNPYLREHAFRYNQMEEGREDLFTILLRLACKPGIGAGN